MSLIDSIIGTVINVHQELSGSDSVSFLASPGGQAVSLTKPTKSLEPKFLSYQEKLALETEVVDWIVRAADFGTGVNFDPPEEGSEIRETVGTTVRTYRVSRFNAEPPWRFLDSSESHIRIHTVLNG